MADRITFAAIAFFCLFVGAALRIAGMWSDIWLDEAWTIELVSRFNSPVQIVSQYQHSTNHLLNSILMSLAPAGAADYVYRLPAAIASILSIPIFWMAAYRQCGVYAAAPSLMYVFSLAAIVFGTEARGYGFVLLCGLGAMLALDKIVEREDWRWIAAFWVCCIGGFFAHVSFVVFFAAIAVWSLSVDTSGRLERSIDLTVKCHLVPSVIFFLVYDRFYRFVPLDAPDVNASLWRTIVSAASVAVGGPEYWGDAGVTPLLALLAAGAVGVVGCLEGALLVSHGSRYVLLYLGAIVIMPLLGCLTPIFGSGSLDYFLMPIVVSYFVIGGFLSRMAALGLLGRTAAALLVGLFCFGNLSRYQEFRELGRGRMRRAFEYIAAQSYGPQAAIAGSEDVGTELLVSYYAPRITSAKPIVYRSADDPSRSEAEWYLIRSRSLSPNPDKQIELAGGNTVVLEKVFRRSIISGTNLYVYHRVRRVLEE